MTKLVIPVLERIFSLEVLWRHVGVDFFFFFWSGICELWIIKLFFIEVLFQILCSQTNSYWYDLTMLLLKQCTECYTIISFCPLL